LAKWQKMYQENRESPEYKRLTAESQRLEKVMQKYVEVKGERQGSADVPHGYVWLFRQK
jgi:hypothetical protein